MVFKLLMSILLMCSPSLIATAESLKILGLFPHPAISHFHVFHPIMRGLADAGHDVTVVSHFPDENAPANYKDLHLPSTDSLTNAIDLELFAHRPSYKHIQDFLMIQEWGIDACENALNYTAIQIVLQQTFDIILMEQFNCDCMMAIAWKINAPVIGMSSCVLLPWLYDRVGSPLIPSYMPSFLGYSDEMSLSERSISWISINAMNLFYNYITLKKNDEIVRKYLKDDKMPNLSELVKETSMIFVNTHHSFEGPWPNAPTIVEIGGVHIKDAQTLDPEIKAILDSAKDGVIYVSWGSMIRSESLPVEKRNSFLKAFGSVKQTIVWKWENETLSDQPKNVFIRKWMPQRDILCHPNVRVFMSHGGLLGTSESIHCGVPMIITPLFGDQFHNAAVAQARGMAWILPYDDISVETINTSITNALSLTTKNNAKQVSFSFKNRQQTPIETAIWWIEYVATTRGAPLLKSPSIHLSVIQYYSIDVLAIIALAFSILMSPFIFVICECTKKSNTQQHHNHKAKKE